MPKLPIVSGTDAIRALERLGFVITRQRGGHMKSPSPHFGGEGWGEGGDSGAGTRSA
jgi:predicted RNA binding protein YcfA (HicA-like mRNA interferase family)